MLGIFDALTKFDLQLVLNSLVELNVTLRTHNTNKYFIAQCWSLNKTCLLWRTLSVCKQTQWAGNTVPSTQLTGGYNNDLFVNCCPVIRLDRGHFVLGLLFADNIMVQWSTIITQRWERERELGTSGCIQCILIAKPQNGYVKYFNKSLLIIFLRSSPGSIKNHARIKLTLTETVVRIIMIYLLTNSDKCLGTCNRYLKDYLTLYSLLT